MEFKTKKREDFVFKLDGKEFSLPHMKKLKTRQVALLSSENKEYFIEVLEDLAPGITADADMEVLEEIVEAWIDFSGIEVAKK